MQTFIIVAPVSRQTIGKIEAKSSFITIIRPPNKRLLLQMSYGIWSTASKEKQYCISTLSQIRRVFWCKRSSNFDFLPMLHCKLLWKLRRI